MSNYYSECGTKQEKKSSLILGDDLKVNKYRNGDYIPQAISNEQWVEFAENKIGAYSITIDKEGKSHYLYNWYAVDDSRGLAPEGWRIPTNKEWGEIEKQLKENVSYAGYRLNNFGDYYNIGNYGFFWSSTEHDDITAWNRKLHQNDIMVYQHYLNKQNGFSVRCVKEKK